MTARGFAPRCSTGSALLVGVAAGVVVLAVYVGAGLLVANWDVGVFLDHLSVSTAGSLALTCSLVVGTVALPVALYLRARLVAPLATLVLVTAGWFAYGALAGFLSRETVFGFSLYLLLLAPVLVGLSLVLGGGEYVARRRGLRP